jgi:hypothetical protein
VPGLPIGHDRCRGGLVWLEPWSELSPDGGGLLPQGLVDRSAGCCSDSSRARCERNLRRSDSASRSRPSWFRGMRAPHARPGAGDRGIPRPSG